MKKKITSMTSKMTMRVARFILAAGRVGSAAVRMWWIVNKRCHTTLRILKVMEVGSSAPFCRRKGIGRTAILTGTGLNHLCQVDIREKDEDVPMVTGAIRRLFKQPFPTTRALQP